MLQSRCSQAAGRPQSSPIFPALARSRVHVRSLQREIASAKTRCGRYKLPAMLHFLKWHNPHRRYSCYDCCHRHSRQIRARKIRWGGVDDSQEQFDCQECEHGWTIGDWRCHGSVLPDDRKPLRSGAGVTRSGAAPNPYSGAASYGSPVHARRPYGAGWLMGPRTTAAGSAITPPGTRTPHRAAIRRRPDRTATCRNPPIRRSTGTAGPPPQPTTYVDCNGMTTQPTRERPTRWMKRPLKRFSAAWPATSLSTSITSTGASSNRRPS